MKHFSAALLFLLCCTTANAQLWNWALESQGTSTTGANYPHDVVADSHGNSYVVGEFNSNLVFAPNNVLSPGHIFIVKFDSAGNYVWGRAINPLFQANAAASVTLDANEDVILCGEYYGTITFGTTSITSVGQNDAFLAKISSGGTWMWAKSYGGPSYDWAADVACDAAGNIYMTGVMVDTVMFDAQPLNASAAYYVTFVAKFDNAGTCQWVQGATGAGNTKGTTVTVSPAGTVYAGGVFALSPSIFGTAMNATNQVDEFEYIARFDTNGTLDWCTQFSCNSVNNMSGLNSIAADADDNVYFAGNYYFSCSIGQFTLPPPAGVRHSFVGKMDSTGTVQWAYRGYGPTNNWSTGVAIDSLGNSYFTGFFTDTIHFPGCHAINMGGNGYIVTFDGEGQCACLSYVQHTVPEDIFIRGDSLWQTGWFYTLAYFGSITLNASNPAEFYLGNSTLCTNPLDIGNSASSEKISSLYPNPGSENFTIENSWNGTTNVHVYNSVGALVFSSAMNATTTINSGNWPVGIYLVKLESENNAATLRFVKE